MVRSKKVESRESENDADIEELEKLDEILSHVRSLDAQMPWALRAQAGQLKPLLLDYFKKRQRAARVYLAVDGRKTSGDIAKDLNIHVQNVSYELSELESRGLVELKSWGIYKKSKIDSILLLSRELRKQLESEN